MKWWKKVFVIIFQLAVINSMVIYFRNNPEFAAKYQSHKLCRVQLIHQLAQPLLDCKASGEISYYGAGRRPAKINEVRLVVKHYPESKHLLKKCCLLCGYKKKGGKYAYKKISNYCAKCDKFVCKDCFELYHTKSNLRK